MSIPVFQPFIKRKDMHAVLSYLVSVDRNIGDEVEKFKNSLLEFTKYPTGLVLREPMRGIELALNLLNLGRGTRVAISALSSDRYLKVFRLLGIEPILLDVCLDLPILHVLQFETIVDKYGLDGLILDHHLGFSPNLLKLANCKIKIIQDISTIISPSVHRYCIGDICLLNLEFNNILYSAGGIFLASKKKPVHYENCLNNFSDDIYLSDLHASLGFQQLKQLDFLLHRCNELHNMFLAIHPRHRLLVQADAESSPPSETLLPFFLASPLPKVVQYAAKNGVELLPAFNNSIIMQLIQNSPNTNLPAQSFPESIKFASKTVLFPLHPSLKKREIEKLLKLARTLP